MTQAHRNTRLRKVKWLATALKRRRTVTLRRWETRGGEAVGASNFRRVLQHCWGEAKRNTSTDGGYLLLIAVWDCGIDGVETDLSLCLAHGTGTAAIPHGAMRGH